ncbi:MAG: DUF501 domain-containing protein [Actinobacteria bacterium]|nr:DUF501 domain-containing protein [Actinomycetota bacterium]
MDEVVEAQLGRPLRSSVEVVSSCHLGLPVVVRVPPRLDDGTPFPTLYWLTCPLARVRVGRLESGGGVRRMEQKTLSDPEFADRLERAHEDYRSEREGLDTGDEGPTPSGGVGGAAAGVKCLHAHYAHTRAGRDNPVGELVASWVEPLDCEIPCVLEGMVNPAWTARP